MMVVRHEDKLNQQDMDRYLVLYLFHFFQHDLIDQKVDQFFHDSLDDSYGNELGVKKYLIDALFLYSLILHLKTLLHNFYDGVHKIHYILKQPYIVQLFLDHLHTLQVYR